MRRSVLAAVAALALAPAAFADSFQPADVLVYTRWKYVWNAKTRVAVPKGAYHHLSTEIGAEQVRRYFGDKGYSCLVTDDPAVWDSDAFKKAKCVFFLNTQHEQFANDAQRSAFYAAVSNGLGVVVTHSSSWNEHSHPQLWRDFLGGFFSYHYRRQQPVPFTHVDHTHPAFAFFPEDYVWEREEIYLNHPKEEGLRPLLMLKWDDVLPESRAQDKEGCPKAGGHVLAWCKTYGKGRVFYTALGHNPKDWSKREFLYHLLMATKWAMGELPDRVDGGKPISLAPAKAHRTIDGAELVRDGQTVWKLNLANREAKPFIHPLCLPDGRCVTELRPKDHPWHLGLFFCWKFINGLNYWEPRGPSHGNLFPDGMTVVRDFDIRPNGGACDVSLKIWYGPRAEPGRILLDEARTLAFSAPDAAGRYAIRAKHVFTAREKVVLNARRPIAYGGFSLRFQPFMKNFEVASNTGAVPKKAFEACGPKEMTELTYTDPATGHGLRIKTLKGADAERLYYWADNRFAGSVPMYAEPLTLEPGQTLELEYEVSVF